MPINTIRGNFFFWKIIAVFSMLLIVLGIVFMIIASRFSTAYYTAAQQELYGDIATHLAKVTHPFKHGRPDTAVTHDIIHSVMTANPAVEVYLLDTSGNIVDYVVPGKSVQMHAVDITKIKQWLTTQQGERPLGDNPRQPGNPGIFSAALVYEHGQPVGYIYAVLSGEKQQQVLAAVNNHLCYGLAIKIFLSALLVIFIVGAIIFFLITDTLCQIALVVEKFKEGDHTARIEGHSKGNIGTLTTTFNEMADVIVANFEKITAIDKFRQELIANVSHDLRTPLSIMQGYTETLIIKKSQLTQAEEDKYLSIVFDGTKKLSLLVDQLFQYAKLEANQVLPEKEYFMLGELASDILAAYQLKATERSISLTLDTENNVPAIFADLPLTERVLQNLLDNAFAFTPDGGCITIKLSSVAKGVEVQVIDTGIGIAPEDQTYIFERYKWANNGHTPKKGMGIGLAIVKKILELHHTGIEVSSKAGKGTTFYFVMPAP